MRIEHQADPAPADAEAVREGLRRYNRRQVGPTTHDEVAFFLRDDAGAIVGGVLGDVWLGWLHVEFLWVDDAYRGQGHGAELLRRAERFGRERGARMAFLDTFSFQAGRAYYERHGYEAFGELAEPGLPYVNTFLRKML